jgi:hypothetical protein
MAGCSQHDGSSSTAASSTTAGVCSSVGELRASVAELRDVPVVQEGVSALQSAFASVRPDVAQVVQDAQSQYAAQTEGPTADVAAVQTAVGQAEASPTRATLDAVVGSIGALADDWPRSPMTSPRPADQRGTTWRIPAAMSTACDRGPGPRGLREEFSPQWTPGYRPSVPGDARSGSVPDGRDDTSEVDCGR